MNGTRNQSQDRPYRKYDYEVYFPINHFLLNVSTPVQIPLVVSYNSVGRRPLSSFDNGGNPSSPPTGHLRRQDLRDSVRLSPPLSRVGEEGRKVEDDHRGHPT